MGLVFMLCSLVVVVVVGVVGVLVGVRMGVGVCVLLMVGASVTKHAGVCVVVWMVRMCLWVLAADWVRWVWWRPPSFRDFRLVPGENPVGQALPALNAVGVLHAQCCDICVGDVDVHRTDPSCPLTILPMLSL